MAGLTFVAAAWVASELGAWGWVCVVLLVLGLIGAVSEAANG